MCDVRSLDIVVPTQAGTCAFQKWIPAFAGMTGFSRESRSFFRKWIPAFAGMAGLSRQRHSFR